MALLDRGDCSMACTPSDFSRPGANQELPAYRCVTFVKEPVERTQYLPRDCSMNLVNSREKPLLIAGSAALRRCSRRRGFSPAVLLLAGGFHQRSPKLCASFLSRRSISERRHPLLHS